MLLLRRRDPVQILDQDWPELERDGVDHELPDLAKQPRRRDPPRAKVRKARKQRYPRVPFQSLRAGLQKVRKILERLYL